MRKFSQDIKGLFWFGNVQVRSLRGQPRSPVFGRATAEPPEKPANGGLSRFCRGSPPSHFAILVGQLTESLRPARRIFPFSRDSGRRLGSITTARGRRQWTGFITNGSKISRLSQEGTTNLNASIKNANVRRPHGRRD